MHARESVEKERTERMGGVLMEKDCFGNINPEDAKCVPNCSRFIECYNEMQKRETRTKIFAASSKHGLTVEEAADVVRTQEIG